MTSFTLRNASPAKTKADVVVVGVRSGETPTVATGGEEVAKAYGRKFAPMLAALGVTGKAGETTKIPTNGTISASVLVLVGLGAEETGDSVRRGAGAAARAIGNAASVAIALPCEDAALVRAAAEGFLLGSYTFNDYKSGADATTPSEVVWLSPIGRKKEATDTFAEAQAIAAAVIQARGWVNTPPGDLTPPVFADAAVEAGKAYRRGANKVTVTVLDETKLAELGCGGLIGVGRGSAAPPRLVELNYKPRGAKMHLALVGKGITFDSGGLSIKPASGMHEMKSDMAGAAAVIAATYAIAELGLPIQVSTYAAMAENMLSGDATRPGDVLTMYDGTTVEVQNTDAEGRLVLADALGRAVEKKPDVILDVATLTGAMVVALGDHIAGVMGSEDIVAQVMSASDAAGELHWPMPLPEHMETRIKSSKVADLAQVDWIRWGGGLFAGAFLREFTGGLPWAHLDIAGPGFNGGGPVGHITAGGTGFAVPTLVEFARALSQK